mgnify:CR=1 FL=1
MPDYADYATRLKTILHLRREPVSVSFIPNSQPLPQGFDTPPNRRYCQVLMEAGEGQRVLLTPETIACPASAAALGFKPLPPKPRLEMGQYRAVAAAPLWETSDAPDVVIIESLVEHLMWIALASVRQTGGRLDLSTAILQATCVDGTILPFVSGRLNASLGCYGCREATDMEEGEAVLGFPAAMLGAIVEQIEALGERAMGRIRGKAVYRALQGRA